MGLEIDSVRADIDPMRSLLVTGLVVFALVGGGWAWERDGRAANESALGAVASELAGRPVRVECQSLWSDLFDVNGRLGDVPFPDGHPADHTYLTRAMCTRLRRFRSASSHPGLDCLLEVDWSAWSFQRDYYSPVPCGRGPTPRRC